MPVWFVQGPFTVRAGSSTTVTFRNVFAETTTFQFYVDNPQFHVSKSSESIRARKDHKIAVSYDTGSDASSQGKAAATPVAGSAISLLMFNNANLISYFWLATWHG